MLLNDAINICLRYIGETPVPMGTDIKSLDPLHEAVIVKEILEQTSEDLQSVGWWFNKETWTFTPDVHNKIDLSSDVLCIETADDYIKRGGSLYNRENKTYEFTKKVEATVFFKWDFEDLPRAFASYVTYMSAKQAQMFLNGDDFIDKDLEKHIGMAYTRVQKAQVKQSNYNLVKGNRLAGRTSLPSAVT